MTTTAAEEWRQIKDSAGYEVSDLGRIRICGGRILKPRVRENGRLEVNHKAGSERFQRYVHLAVLEAFVAPREWGFKAFFEDGDVSNCALSNLDWVLTETERQRARMAA